MRIDPRTPVLVGACVMTPRADSPTDLPDVVQLMATALEAAARDAGATSLLGALDQVAVPQGSWALSDPASMVASSVGANRATTALYEIGVLQQEMFDDACTRIASGELEVAAVVGGEVRNRALQARLAGIDLAEPVDPGRSPDRTASATSLGVHDLEIIRNAVTPAVSYALIESALAHSAGRGPSEELDFLGELWAGFASVAASNPLAWDRSDPSANEIVAPNPGNRMISTPYTKLLCSQWNVDQAAALILCSAEAAESHGVPRERWVLPRSSAIANHAVPVLQREDLHRSVGAELAGPQALELAGLQDIQEVRHLDVYSCFPSAVQVLAGALALPTSNSPGSPPFGRALTVTGGLTFGGGPLNNYVLGALATMVPLLRAAPTSFGLVSSVSGFLVKQGFGVWSATAPAEGWRHEDLTAEVAAHPASAPLPVVDDHEGPARIVAWTVAHDKGEPARAVVIADIDDARDATSGPARTLGSTSDPEVVSAMCSGEWIGRTVHIRPDGTFAAF